MADIELVMQALAQTPLGRRINDHQVSVLCPVCGENYKPDRRHSHCYVGPIQGHPPIVYHCWINECSGVVTPSFLHDLNIFDPDLDMILNNYNRSSDNKFYYTNSKINDPGKPRKVELPDVKDTELNQYKLYYMKQRLGVDFSYDNLKGLKVIFSLNDLLKYNGIPANPKYSKFQKKLDQDYIGFLSTLNDWVILRNTKPNNNMRYIKYSLFGQIDTSNIVYTLPGTQADLFSDYVELNICEGTFDAIGVFCHVKKYNRINSIYAACCGSGYINPIRYFIRMGFIGNLHVNIYSDKDKDMEFYRTQGIYEKIEPWVEGIDIFYNERSKDYGVPRSEISVMRAINS